MVGRVQRDGRWVGGWEGWGLRFGAVTVWVPAVRLGSRRRSPIRYSGESIAEKPMILTLIALYVFGSRSRDKL